MMAPTEGIDPRDQAVQARIQEEAIFGRLPLLASEREYDFRGMMSTGFAYAVATWCFLIGGYAAQYVGAVQGMVTLLAGCTIGVVLSAIASALACNRYGLEQIDFTKTCFGQRGARFILLFYVVNQLGWSGIVLVMSSQGLQSILKETAGWDGGAALVSGAVLVSLLVCYAIVVRGVHVLNMWNAIVTPGLVAVCALIFWVIFRDHSFAQIAACQPTGPTDDAALNYAISFEFGLGAGFSWWPGIGFLARNTDNQRNSFYPQVLTMGVGMGVVCWTGLFATLLFQKADPTTWMVAVGGRWLGVAALLLVLIANISASSIMMYTAGLAMRHVPACRKMNWNLLLALVFVPVLAFVIWPQELYAKGNAFLPYNATMYAPISGLLVVDYLILRRQRLDAAQIFSDDKDGDYWFWGGFNWLSLSCLAVGYAIYLALFDPVSSTARGPFKLVTASIPATVVPMVLYGVLAPFLLKRKGGYRETARPRAIEHYNI